MIKFNEVVSIKRNTCKTCFSLIYKLPCRLDDNFKKYFIDFGKSLFSNGHFIKIISSAGFEIEGQIGKNQIKFIIPKELEKGFTGHDKKDEFETALLRWMIDKLDILIERENE